MNKKEEKQGQKNMVASRPQKKYSFTEKGITVEAGSYEEAKEKLKKLLSSKK